MKKIFPTLYKKTSTGAIQFWTIIGGNIEYINMFGNMVVAPAIRTTYGQLDTENPQITLDTIREGKNIGKKNETTAEQQAIAEAQAKWEKQLKKGYVQNISDAEAGNVDAVVEGGVVPMLAQSFSKHAAKITFPCFTQPKLDGIRCIAVIEDGACTLWSRTRKQIHSMPHIVQELEALFEDKTITLDGELYNHQYKKDFEEIVSLVRQEKPGEGHEIVQYHIYDMVDSVASFADRTALLSKRFGLLTRDSSIRLVKTLEVKSEELVMDYFDEFVGTGYEGAMLRNKNSKYVNKRSYDLQKVKEFDDAEFRIVGIEEGRGKLAGHVGAFVCITDGEKTFNAKAKGETGRLKDYFNDRKLWEGKRLTVQFQGLTGYGIPRFPVGLRIREEE